MRVWTRRADYHSYNVSTASGRSKGPSARRHLHRSLSQGFLLILFWKLLVPFRSTMRLLQVIVIFVTSAGFSIYAMAYVLRRCIADYYVQTSTSFARFNDFLSDRLQACYQNKDIPINGAS